MSSIAIPWAVEVGIITARDLTSDEHRPPLPSELLASFVVFGALAGLSIPAPKPATYVGWGIVIATLLATQVDFLAPVGDFLAGKPPPGGKPPKFFGDKATTGQVAGNLPIKPPTGQVAGNLGS